MRVLVTGSAGFIGNELVLRLLARGDQVVGIDNLNDYYDVRLKQARLARISNNPQYTHYQFDIEDKEKLDNICNRHKPHRIVNLAAQAGVRYSLTNPFAYLDSNLSGFLNILEVSRHHNIDHLVYASSSSVYGSNTALPFSVHQNVDHPISLYAATKKSNELMAHAYSHLFSIPTTGLRFFTVYGPWGRPDMAMYLFAKAINDRQPIKIFNYGDMRRDFTYITDIVEGVIRVLDRPPKKNSNWSDVQPDPSSSSAPYKIYNIGNNSPINLMYVIELIEERFGSKAIKEFLPMQPGDVKETFADVDDLVRDTGFQPSTSIEFGVESFVDWFKSHV